MKKWLLYFFLTMSAWAMSYDEAVQKAQKEEKKILVELVMESCPYCERMEKFVLSNQEVKNMIEAHFVFIVLDIHKDTIPEQLISRMTPTFYFLSHNGEKILHEIKGAPSKSEFLNHLTNITHLKDE